MYHRQNIIVVIDIPKLLSVLLVCLSFLMPCEYHRCKANNSEVEETWESEEGKPEMSKSFAHMADGIIQSMVYRSAGDNRERVWLNDVEHAAISNA